ncbi:multicopper oxidase [Halalkalicoccus paucihalophilus]|uniref:Multicopper oxidase n=2 Tax=Halalkalicoccus paucihalophilus TaxID=1008153 RepID=A0A151A9P9_9EURY|nr:multicopper oxidase [Halalkalicoccus paucihalophilus]
MMGGGYAAQEDLRAAMRDEPTKGGKVRHFDVHAVEVDIVYNAFGVHQPNGAMYVLKENKEAVRKASGEIPGRAFDDIEDTHDIDHSIHRECDGDHDHEDDCDCHEKRDREKPSGVDTSVIQPLTIRANVGDVIEIEFHNDLDRRASIHQTALPYDVQDSDGMSVGFNEDTTVAPGDSITYRWFASNTGSHFFYDGANQAYDSADEPPQKANLLSRSLFGAAVVYDQGVTWTDPKTGGELNSGVRADIHDPEVLETSYREFVTFYHTPEGIKPDIDFPDSDVEQTTHAINYRSDQTGIRIEDRCPDCDLEEFFYNSWTNGDPGGGDNVYETYKGDPIKFTIVGASVEENHVHHLHQHRWKEIPPRTDADTVDAQTVGLGATYEAYFLAGHGDVEGATTVRPEMTFEEAFEVGAGYVHGSAGDTLFHCHLFPHYGEGMWGIMRIHDKEQKDLQPLPNTGDLVPPDGVGFPEFIPGEQGVRPPERPDDREPTPTEEEVLDGVFPVAPYADPCVDKDAPKRTYNIVALNTDVVYNDAGEHDPEGVVYVLEKHADLVREGKMNPEPLFIRANVGDCVELNLKNETERGISIHTHFVGFDLLGSDSLATGYNYDQQTPAGEKRTYRWYADEEGPIFFHDHISGIDDVMNGSFAGLIVEPEGSVWRDPYTGNKIKAGAQAIIERPDGEDFREQCLHYHDFAQLRDRDGDFITNQEQHNENQGTMAINYRNSPYYNRNDPDPAYVHSSSVHGDPETPVLETYPEDTVRIRLFQGAYEEQHDFFHHMHRFNARNLNPEFTVSQVIGTSEVFTFELDLAEQENFEMLHNPSDLPVHDHLFGSAIDDDLWTGMWGMHRLFDAKVDHLQPLPDQGVPDERITKEELREMGHWAGFTDRWKELGQKWRLIYPKGADRDFPADKQFRQNKNVGEIPPKAPDPGEPCEMDAPVRKYKVTAFNSDIKFNEYGDHDPHGIIFALDEHVEDIKCGRRPPTPLVLRANQGECIEVELTNDLDEFDGDHDHPQMRITRDWDRSKRISLHPQRITYDINGSDGATVGFNFDQTIEPGDSITYRWFADELLDNCVLWDMADVRSNRHHGSFGTLIVSPADTEWLSPRTAEPYSDGSDGTPAASLPDAMIKTPGNATGGATGNQTGDTTVQPTSDFREFTLSFSSGRYIINREDPDNCVVPVNPDDPDQDPDAPCNQIGDAEDQGYGAINNRAEPFIRRFERNSDEQHLVFNSEVHGDPATPVLNAFQGDPVAFQVQTSTGKSRGMRFHLSDHQWPRFVGPERNPPGEVLANPPIEGSPTIGVDDRFGVGLGLRFDMLGGAGGLAQSTGDFIYQETLQRRQLEAGLWGIFRVRDQPQKFANRCHPLPDRANGVPIEERPGWIVGRTDMTDSEGEDTAIIVPDSDMGPAGSMALHCFAEPLEDASIPDLADPDMQVVFHADEDNGRLNATVHQPSDMEPANLVEMLSDTTIEVVNAEIIEPVEAVEEGVDIDASEDPDEIDVDESLSEMTSPPLDGEQLNVFVETDLMVETPEMDEPENLGPLVEDMTMEEGMITLEWSSGSTTEFTNNG